MFPRILGQGARAVPCLALAVAACGGWSRIGSDTSPSPGQTLTAVLDETALFRRVGRLAADGPVPFVGDIALLPGPGDSVIGVLALSLENRALGFERQGDRGFVARYRVDIALRRDSLPPVTIGRDQTVRVTTFQETLRNEESVLFQEPLRLAPGRYQVTVSVRDRSSEQQSRAERTLDVRPIPPGHTSAPVFVYDVTARRTPDEPFRGILNPRAAAGYGMDTLVVMVEGRQMPAGATLPIVVVDGRDSVLLRQALTFSGADSIETRLLRFTPDSAPLGELRFVVGPDSARQTAIALVSLSSNWIVSNYDQMVDLLRYFGHEQQLDALRHATPADRPRLWQRFYKDSDPNPATPENEALDAYFGRLGVADRRFADEGEPGWRTDRGEVFITLGDPDEQIDASAPNQGRIIRWTYNQWRVVLFFVDETGFGRFRLTPQSRADFERVRARLWREQDR
ncbi:MAG TPA: GWxTD domain-containing protein [Gemmatimonadales bacterium]|nr:GWxTD domain-containing protein [Gemmatimonadales bacterium]